MVPVTRYLFSAIEKQERQVELRRDELVPCSGKALSDGLMTMRKGVPAFRVGNVVCVGVYVTLQVRVLVCVCVPS